MGESYKFVSYEVVKSCFKNQRLNARLRLCYMEFAIAVFVEREVAELDTDIENVWRAYVSDHFVQFSM